MKFTDLALETRVYAACQGSLWYGINPKEAESQWKDLEPTLERTFTKRREADLDELVQSSAYLRQILERQGKTEARRRARNTLFGKQKQVSAEEAEALDRLRRLLEQPYWQCYPPNDLTFISEETRTRRGLRTTDDYIKGCLRTANQTGRIPEEPTLQELVQNLARRKICRVSQYLQSLEERTARLSPDEQAVLGTLLFYDLPDKANEAYTNEASRLTNYARLAQTIQRGLKNRELTFLQFYCPKIDAAQLLTTPSFSDGNYIDLNMEGNNFQTTASRLRALTQSLQKLAVRSKLTLVGGNSDEEDYVFPTLGIQVDRDNLRSRQREQANLLQRQAQKLLPELNETNVYLWTDLAPPTPPSVDTSNLSPVFSDECERMWDLFKVYYREQLCVSEAQLTRIVDDKFKMYRRQGLRLTERFPDAVFLQSEFPRGLRTQMLGLTLPALYPYLKRDSPY